MISRMYYLKALMRCHIEKYLALSPTMTASDSRNPRGFLLSFVTSPLALVHLDKIHHTT